jgi:hypothetical protein
MQTLHFNIRIHIRALDSSMHRNNKYKTAASASRPHLRLRIQRETVEEPLGAPLGNTPGNPLGSPWGTLRKPLGGPLRKPLVESLGDPRRNL